jgi:hypothetical protein
MKMIARSLSLAIALLAATSAAAFGQTRDDVIAAPVLRASVTVSGDLVRIGDVIDNAGPTAQIPIYRALDSATGRRWWRNQPLHQVIGVDAGPPEIRYAPGAHARRQGHRAAGRPRAGTPQRPRRRRQSQHDLRPRSGRRQAGTGLHRRMQPTVSATTPQRPLQSPSRYRMKTPRRR